MGRTYEDLKVCWTVSRHNSEQDDIDDRLAKELSEEIEAVVSQEKYQPISPMVV